MTSFTDQNDSWITVFKCWLSDISTVSVTQVKITYMLCTSSSQRRVVEKAKDILWVRRSLVTAGTQSCFTSQLFSSTFNDNFDRTHQSLTQGKCQGGDKTETGGGTQGKGQSFRSFVLSEMLCCPTCVTYISHWCNAVWKQGNWKEGQLLRRFFAAPSSIRGIRGKLMGSKNVYLGKCVNLR